MKSQKLTIALSFAVLTIVLSAAVNFLSDVVALHNHYKTYYNYTSKETDSVVWDLTPAMVDCPDQARNDAFKKDPSVPNCASPNDYAVNSKDKASKKYNPDRASWIDEGHLFSYQDAMCNSADKVECFYMSNMLPQFHGFNAGDWKTLEVQCRVWAKTQTLHIVAGGYGVCKTSKLFPTGHLPAGEVIPAYMWKAIYMGGKWNVWIMPNSGKSVGDPYGKWLSSIHTFDLASIGDEIKREKI